MPAKMKTVFIMESSAQSVCILAKENALYSPIIKILAYNGIEGTSANPSNLINDLAETSFIYDVLQTKGWWSKVDGLFYGRLMGHQMSIWSVME